MSKKSTTENKTAEVLATTSALYQTLPVNKIMHLKNSGLIRLPVYQRPESAIWKRPANTALFLDTIMRRYYCPPILMELIKADGLHWLADGQQRIVAVSRIISGNPDAGGYVFHTADLGADYVPLPVGDYDDIYPVVNNLPFAMWPIDLQNHFLSYEFQMAQVDADQADLTELFRRLCKGAPMTPAQARRGQFLPKLIALKEFLEAPVWAKVGLVKSSDVEWLAMALSKAFNIEGPYDLESKALVDYFVATELTPEMIKAFIDTAGHFSALIGYNDEADENSRDTFKKVFRKNNVEAVAYALLKGAADNDAANVTYHRLITFFGMKGATRSAEIIEYNKAGQAGTAQLSAVNVRHSTMIKVLNGTALPPVEMSEEEIAAKEAKKAEAEAKKAASAANKAKKAAEAEAKKVKAAEDKIAKAEAAIKAAEETKKKSIAALKGETIGTAINPEVLAKAREAALAHQAEAEAASEAAEVAAIVGK